MSIISLLPFTEELLLEEKEMDENEVATADAAAPLQSFPSFVAGFIFQSES